MLVLNNTAHGHRLWYCRHLPYAYTTTFSALLSFFLRNVVIMLILLLFMACCQGTLFDLRCHRTPPQERARAAPAARARDAVHASFLPHLNLLSASQWHLPVSLSYMT